MVREVVGSLITLLLILILYNGEGSRGRILIRKNVTSDFLVRDRTDPKITHYIRSLPLCTYDAFCLSLRTKENKNDE